MDTQHLEYLFEQHDSKRITEAEKTELYDFLGNFQNKEEVFDFFEASISKTPEDTAQDKDKWRPVIEKILASPQIPLHKEMGGNADVRRIFPWKRVAAAAVIIFMLGTGSYFLFFNHVTLSKFTLSKAEGSKYKNDVAPGGNKAILTLSNGTQIILDSAANGTLTQQGDTKIIKLDSGQLAYRKDGNGSSPLGEEGVRPDSEVGLNTITTPRGGQYQIVLADGSKVWLNAASSLRYPTAFSGKERNVELSGEGYFEIAHNSKMPFHVKVNDMTVEVLGTHFNINAYDDEAIIKTTLLEGSVKVSLPSPKGEGLGVRLKPGEQAQVAPLGVGGIMVQTVDVDEAVAWKNGLFSFNRSDIQSVMRQLARWYDVEVVFEGKAPPRLFGGEIQRNILLSKVLENLEKNGVHFRIEGKKIIVVK